MIDPKNISISVVIPVKDRKEALLRAVRSVISQTFPVKEIIVVDDGSAESLERDLQSFRNLHYFRNETSQGAPRARNMGWQGATSDLIAFLDSDDELEPQTLANKIAYLQSNNLDMVVGSIKLNDGKTVSAIRYNPDPTLTLRDNLLGNRVFDARTSTFLVKRSVIAEIPFDEKLRKHQDWDVFINIDSRYKTGFTNECDTIIHVADTDRISNSLKHDATVYFVEKNKDKVGTNALFMFLVKMVFRAQRLRDLQGEITYRKLIRDHTGKLNLRNSVLRMLLLQNLISAKVLHKLKRLIKR